MVVPSPLESSPEDAATVPESPSFPPVEVTMANLLKLHASQTDSPDSTESIKTPKTAIRNRNRKTFCKVCQSSIVKEGGRSQGARRHLLQHHIKKSLFRCTVCDYSSNYDKGHVKAHIRRIHGGVGDVQPLESDEGEEKLWMELCFGKEEYFPGRGLLQNGGGNQLQAESQQNIQPEEQLSLLETPNPSILPQIDPQLATAALQQMLQNAMINLYQDLLNTQGTQNNCEL